MSVCQQCWLEYARQGDLPSMQRLWQQAITVEEVGTEEQPCRAAAAPPCEPAEDERREDEEQGADRSNPPSSSSPSSLPPSAPTASSSSLTSAHSPSSPLRRPSLLDCQDENGRTALFLCCLQDDAAAVRWLLQSGADTSIRDKWQQSALLKSIINGCTECVQLLVDAGADPNVLDESGQSGAHWACEFAEVTCVRLLWQRRDQGLFDPRHPQQLSLLMSAARLGNDRTLTFLLEETEAEMEKGDECGKTALIYSAMNGNLTCLQLLLSHGAQVDGVDEEGDTALVWAAWQGQAECLQHLLQQAGANINHQNQSGLTALMQAVRWGHADCVRILLDHGADPTLTSKTGSSAWSLAVCADQPDESVIEWLSEAAAAQEQARAKEDSSD